MLDASAVLSLLHGERGSEAVRQHLSGSAMSVVNAAECIDVLTRAGAPVVRAVTAIADLDVELVDCDWAIASTAAQIRARGAKLGLSLADCICLATARARGARAVTADRAWKQLDVGVAIEVIR